MIIRQETPKDYKEVYHIVKNAFATTDYSDGSEADYLNDIRERDSFIPELSLVAEDNNKIIGQIVLYNMQINCGKKVETQLLLSPISVHPDYFKQGVGSALINRACNLAVNMGYKAVFLCGNPEYYSKFGFIPTYKYDVYHINDKEKNAEWCMVKELSEGYLKTISGSIDIE